jgi:hypothetical protein
MFRALFYQLGNWATQQVMTSLSNGTAQQAAQQAAQQLNRTIHSHAVRQASQYTTQHLSRAIHSQAAQQAGQIGQAIASKVAEEAKKKVLYDLPVEVIKKGLENHK